MRKYNKAQDKGHQCKELQATQVEAVPTNGAQIMRLIDLLDVP